MPVQQWGFQAKVSVESSIEQQVDLLPFVFFPPDADRDDGNQAFVDSSANCIHPGGLPRLVSISALPSYDGFQAKVMLRL
jgi:hypothetical protein